MRHSLFCTVILAVVVPSTFTLSASAQSTHAVTVAMHPCDGMSAVIPVTLNGTGPYDFLLDTGTNTTVIDTALFNQLGLRQEGTMELQSPAALYKEVKSSVEGVAVGALTGKDLEVGVLPKLPFGPWCKTVRGILGENFLKHFDVLIDNQHRQVTLDAGSDLAESLDGERLPVVTTPFAGTPEYRPMVAVRLPQFERHPVKMLLDSGAQTVMMFQQRVEMMALDNRIGTVNGSLPCRQSEDRLGWGKGTSLDVSILICERGAESAFDHAGNLPTSIFHQIFISHAGSYVIVNPAKRLPAQEEIAVVKPTYR